MKYTIEVDIDQLAELTLALRDRARKQREALLNTGAEYFRESVEWTERAYKDAVHAKALHYLEHTQFGGTRGGPNEYTTECSCGWVETHETLSQAVAASEAHLHQ